MKCLARMAAKLWLLVAALLLFACGGGSQSFEYHAADDPPPGPGLFSGPDGTFTIYRSKGEVEAEETEPPSQ
jgi:hypothetical protein